MTSRIGNRILFAMVLLLVVTLGSLDLIYQHATAVNFGIYQQQHNRTIHGHIVALLSQYYSEHGGFSGANTLLASLSRLAPGPMEIVSPTGQIEQGTGPPGTTGHLMDHHLAIMADHRIVGQLYWNAPPHPTVPPEPLGFLAMMNHSLITVTVAALLVAIVLSFVMTRGIVRPIETLTQAAQRIASGHGPEQVRISRRDEIGSLGNAFNEMAEHLRTQHQLRERLVDDVAHELRHPLTHIQGYLEALIDGKIPITNEKLVSLSNETMHLNRLVDDLHRLAQAEAGTLALQCARHSLSTLVEQVIEMQKNSSNLAGVRLLMEESSQWPEVFIDPVRTREILDNVIRNAIQHSVRGSEVWVRGSWTKTHVSLHVIDDGEGIAQEDLPRIFTRFFRADTARSRSQGGVGLGLSIAKHFMRQQAGDIIAESQLGHGTTFTLKFPRSPS